LCGDTASASLSSLRLEEQARAANIARARYEEITVTLRHNLDSIKMLMTELRMRERDASPAYRSFEELLFDRELAHLSDVFGDTAVRRKEIDAVVDAPPRSPVLMSPELDPLPSDVGQ